MDNPESPPYVWRGVIEDDDLGPVEYTVFSMTRRPPDFWLCPVCQTEWPTRPLIDDDDVYGCPSCGTSLIDDEDC